MVKKGEVSYHVVCRLLPDGEPVSVPGDVMTEKEQFASHKEPNALVCCPGNKSQFRVVGQGFSPDKTC